MNLSRIRRLITGMGLTVPLTTFAGCGDPCLDDGIGQLGVSCDNPPGNNDTDSVSDSRGEDMEGDESGGQTQVYCRDADGDGYGDPNDKVTGEPGNPPVGYIPEDDQIDCDDSDPNTFPGAAENEDPNACMNDDDGDGWGDPFPGPGVTRGGDCDDESSTTFPGAAQNEDPNACMNDDDDDGWGDNDPPPGVEAGDDCADEDPMLFGCSTLWCTDLDGDGFGDPRSCIAGGDLPPGPGRVNNDDDCLDTNPDVHTGAATLEPRLCTVDADGDGFGDSNPPPGAQPGTDCADNRAQAYPGAATSEPTLCTIDTDNDGWGDIDASSIDPAIDNGTDCVVDDAAIHPGAAVSEPELCTIDSDGDGFGPSVPPVGGEGGTDCDDTSIFTFPGASENESDPLNTLCTLDADEDGYGDFGAPEGIVQGTDCNDVSANTYPGAAENDDETLCMADEDLDGYGESDPPDGVEAGQDCEDNNNAVTICGQWCFDSDGDGFGDAADCMLSADSPGVEWVANDIDCVDSDATIYPGAASAELELCTFDSDGDGFGPLNPPPGADVGTDCDDSIATTFPGAAQAEAAPINDACTSDVDGDGFGDANPPAGVTPGTDCIDSEAELYVGAAVNEPLLCTVDSDGDGFGADDAVTLYPGADNGTDCVDAMAMVYPGASPNEVGVLATACTIDADSDGFGDTNPPLGVTAGTDCDDGVGTTYPGAAEDESVNECMADFDLDGYGDSLPPAGVTPGQDCQDDNNLVTICGQWCFDSDGDSFGNPSICILSVESPGAQWVANNIDCLDSDANAYPGAAVSEPELCTIDGDSDGYGTSTPPAGVDVGADCSDTSASTFPGAAQSENAPLNTACMADIDDDGYGDSTPDAGVTPGTDCIDNNVDIYVGAAINEVTLCTVDSDGDGFGADDAATQFPGADNGTDCSDSTALAYPGVSQNESGALATACTIDLDEDGFGDANPPPGIGAGTDCDDAGPQTYPGAAEIEDLVACMTDLDLDGYGESNPSEGVTPGQDCEDDNATVTVCGQWCMDTDGDGFGGMICQLSVDAPGVGWVANSNDCVDSNGSIYPGAATAEADLCTIDVDGDGYGDSTPPPGAEAGSDCDDASVAAQPGAAELDSLTACMIDVDDDGYGDASPPPGVTPGTDCSDINANVFVGAASAEPTLCTIDNDGDGYGDAFAATVAVGAQNGSDCSDISNVTYPGAADLEPSLCTIDEDGDGYGDSTPLAGVDAGSDCLDSNANAYPGAAELELGLCAIDEDDDGYGASVVPFGVGVGIDCDDSNASTYPGAAPNDDPLACSQDVDGDGYGSTTPPPGVTPGSDCDDNDPTFADCTCLAPAEYLTCDGEVGAPTGDALAAIGVGCSLIPSESMVLSSSSFAVPDASTWAVINQYGTADDPSNPGYAMWAPRPDAGDPDAQHNAGNNMLLLSTGPISPVGADGVLIEPASLSGGGNTGNVDGAGFPAPLTDVVGSNSGAGGTPFEDCDGTNDCSDALAALGLPGLSMNDQVFFQFEMVVPVGVDGFRFDFAYFSSEYPDYVDTQFNDVFIAWVESDAFTGNVAVTSDGTPFTITELANSGEMTVVGSDPLLAGTGFEGHGATGWRSVLAPVIPGETVQVSFFLTDAADTSFNTAVLIDNFRWDCAGCEGVGDCGLTTLP